MKIGLEAKVRALQTSTLYEGAFSVLRSGFVRVYARKRYRAISKLQEFSTGCIHLISCTMYVEIRVS